MYLDYGYRSKCCYAPIRFGFKLNKTTGIKKQIMICTRCTTRDVDIVYTGQSKGQIVNEKPFAEE